MIKTQILVEESGMYRLKSSDKKKLRPRLRGQVFDLDVSKFKNLKAP